MNAPKRKNKPRAARKTANTRMSHDDVPRDLYVLTADHAAPPNKAIPIAISIILIVIRPSLHTTFLGRIHETPSESDLASPLSYPKV